jgi:hypothetical protein
LNLPRPLSQNLGTSTASGTNVEGMTPGRVKRLERDEIRDRL